MRTKYLFVFIVSVLFSRFSRAQEIGFPVIRNYTPKEYNGTPQIFSAIQDNRGLMYFGEGNGFMEYDGVTWRSIPIVQRCIAYDLAIDKKGEYM